ncbi:amidase [Rhizobium calliandrae]|uniref:Amidase n=1 Tax=Rhizobium calliandrae TaxID=1312182 RepID=A0ABT7KMD2_9HYPH|nr:amidase [Rhizobium calliandrae]MDL2409801.1 amidase [Rhizobium calliandrae]
MSARQDELAFMPLIVARDAIAIGDLCPLNYVDYLLARIGGLDQSIHSFVACDADRARERARHLRDQRKRSNGHSSIGRLFGIPYAVKDIIDVRGYPTTAQSRIMPAVPASTNAAVIERLDASGGVCLGKLTLYEFAVGGSPEFDLPWPAARNPWNLNYMAGSSSSGSGAALSAGLVPLTIGTDTGGSIRSPSMMNGVVGLKPTHGSIDMSGVFPLAPSMDTVGPMARSVADVFEAFAAMTNTEATNEKLRFLEKFSLGVVRHFHETDLTCDVSVSNAIEKCVDAANSAGWNINDVNLPPLRSFDSAGRVTMISEAFTIHKPWLSEKLDLYGVNAAEFLMSGAFISAEEYLRAQNVRRRLRQQVDEALEQHDALLTTVSTLPPCRIDDPNAMQRLAAAATRIPANVTGHPGVAIPTGLSSDGLPVGVQLIGRKHDERKLLRMAADMEEMLGFTSKYPYPNVKPLT